MELVGLLCFAVVFTLFGYWRGSQAGKRYATMAIMSELELLTKAIEYGQRNAQGQGVRTENSEPPQRDIH